MKLEISSTLLARLLTEAAAAPDREVCGLLFGSDARIDVARTTENVAINPGRRFEIDPAALIAAHRQARNGGPQMIGHYHSHPSGTADPSARDAAAALGDGALWLILAQREARLWQTVRRGAFERVSLTIANQPPDGCCT